ncbi:SpaA isopeptide-forming pilin-related protein [uncultured Anaerococcus sp.]|uniref:MSCRAMM family protein n=1 Tax=uncultured Anaerococcus sp. TaxID=293428 RepID=UPI0028043101|nr:SpaA isopeptide-forming pilin-related protein [uncultured Anaerococcus sp.]
MKRERKFRLVALILPILMLIQAFFLAPAGLAKGEVKENLSIEYDISAWSANKAIQENEDKDFFKNFDFKSSQRQVRYWKLDEESLKDKDLLKLRDDYNKKSEKELMADENLGEGQLSELAKIKYDGKLYDKIDFSSEEFKDFTKEDLSKLNTERILIKDLEPGYYLIKETDDSKERVAAMDKESGQKSGELVTAIIKIPDDIKERAEDGSLLYHMKKEVENPTKDLKLIKVDAYDPNIKLDKVQFKLFKRVKDTDSEKSSSEERFKYIPIEVEGSLGTYKFKAEIEDEKLATVLQTNTDGEITVSGLDENSYYVFKEVKAIEGYDKTLNEGIISEAKKPGEGDIIFENKRIPSLIKVKKGTTETLDGVKFAVYKKDGEAKLKFREGKIPGEYIYDEAGDLTDIETKSGGKIYLRELPAGDYYFKEISTIEGYIKSEDSYEFSVDENHNIKVNGELKSVMVENVPENEDNPTPPGENPKGSHSFIKVDKDDHGKKLAGAKFKVQKLVDDKYMTVVRNGSEYIVESDANGALEVTDLEYGHYRLKEVGFPENYNPVDEFTEFDISATSSLNTPVLIENAHKPPKEETPPPTPPTPPETPSTPTKTLTSRSRGPLVKTGDIRIWIYFAIGLLMIVAGFIIIRNQDKKQELA